MSGRARKLGTPRGGRGLITLLLIQANSVTCKGVVGETGTTNPSVRLRLRQCALSHVFTHCQVSKSLKRAYTILFTAGILVVASLNMPINSDGLCPRTMIGVSGFAVADYEYLRPTCALKIVASRVPCPVGTSHV